MSSTNSSLSGRIARGAAVLSGFVALALAQASIRRDPHADSTGATVIFLVAAAAVALLLPRSPITAPSPAPELSARRRRGRIVSLIGVCIASIASIALATRWQSTFDVAAPMLLAGMAVWTVGLAIGDRAESISLPRRRIGKVELALLIAVLAVGIFFRFHRYSEFPPPDGFCAVEEAEAGRTADYILNTEDRPWEFIGDVWLPVPFFYFFGESTTMLRIGFTIVGFLTVPALYFLLRQLVSMPAAIAATGLFAAARWHAIYSRHAHAIFPTTLIVVLALYFCVRAHQRKSLAAYAWLGFLTAYTLYTYAGFRSTPAYVGLFLVLSIASDLWSASSSRRSAVLRRHVVGTSIAAIGAVLAVLPLVGRLYDNPAYFFEAVLRSTVVNPSLREDYETSFWDAKIQQTKTAFALFNHQGDGSEVFNFPPTAMLDAVTGSLLAIGAIYCLFRPTRFRGYFLLIALAQFLLGAVVVTHLDVRRLGSLIPLLFVVIAFGIEGILQFFENFGAKWLRQASHILLTIAVAYAVYDNYRIYFERMMSSERTRWAFQTDYSTGIRYVHSLPDGSYMLSVSNMLNFFGDNDYAWARGNRIPGAVTSDLEPVLRGDAGPWTGKDLYILINDPYEHRELRELITDSIPTATCEPFEGGDTPPWLHFSSCKIPAGYRSNAAKPTLKSRYYHGDDPQPFLEREEPVLSYASYPDECRPVPGHDNKPCRVEYRGTWYVAEAGDYDLLAEAQQNGKVSLQIDGNPITRNPVHLTAGPHEIHGEAHFDTLFEAGARLRMRRAGADPWHLVRFESS